jgi:hypothetical protein
MCTERPRALVAFAAAAVFLTALGFRVFDFADRDFAIQFLTEERREFYPESVIVA